MKCLITGITEQDGYWLTKLLLKERHEVHGIVRRNSSDSIGNLRLLPADLLPKIRLHVGDVTDSESLNRAFTEAKPDRIYQLAAQSLVPVSWANPNAATDIMRVE
jgi:GDPmannose 4,6-dehydratase